MSNSLIFSQSDTGIAVLTFNRPEAMNALTLAMMERLRELVAGLQNKTDLRALVITGAGEKAFCSGGDLIELSGYPGEADARHMITVMGDALLMLENLPVPVIAAMNGYALGGGTEIALACDLRVVDEAVRFGMVQVKMALTPGWGAGQRLLRAVGYARAMQILLQGKSLSAAAMDALGLVNRIVPPGKALETALSLAGEIAALPPDVAQGIKALLRAGLTQPYAEALQTEQAIFPPLWAADPHLQAVERFLKREK